MSNGHISKIQLPSGNTYDIIDNTSGYATEDQVATKANLVIAYVDPNISDNTSTTLYKDIWCEEAYTYTDIWYNDKVRETDDYYYRLMFIGFTNGDGDADYHLYVVSFNNWNFTLYQVDGLSSFYAYIWTAGWSGNAVFTYHALGNTISYNDLSNKPTIPTKTSELTNDSGYITTETDPVFTASAAYGITSSDITNWNGKVSKSGDTMTGNLIFGSKNYNKKIEASYDRIQFYDLAGDNYTTLKGGNGDYSENYTITLPYNSGTVALTSDIPSVPSNIVNTITTTSGSHTTITSATGDVSFKVPTKVSQLTNDSGFITSYTETDPVFNASPAAGITASDISSWDAKVSDDKTWNGIPLEKTSSSIQSDTIYVTGAASTNPNAAYFIPAVSNKTGMYAEYRIAKYGPNGYLVSTTPSANDNSTKVATTAYVDSAITALPEPMIFKGSLGTGGTITTLPAASSSNEGYTYKVITAGTYASQAAKVGDTFISDGSSWVLIPSGDEPSGTVTSVGLSNDTNGGLTISGSPITSSGSITVGHSNVLTSAQTTQAVYPIKIDKNGHISEYGSAVTIPTKTSDLTNDSGFVDTDEKLKTTEASSNVDYLLLLGTNSATASTKSYSTNLGYEVKSDSATIKLGSNGREGIILLHPSTGSSYTKLKSETLTSNRTLTLPDKTGTIATTSDIPTVPSSTGSATTGISIADHSTGSVIGVKSSTTTASKVTLGTAISVPNVTGNTDVTVPIRAESDTTVPIAASSSTDVPIKNTSATTVPTAASSATTVPIKDASATSCDDITGWSAGSGSASLTFTMDTTDTKKLNISFSHSHTAPTLSYTARSITGVQSTTTSVTGVSGSTSIYGVQSTTTSVTGVNGSTTVRGVKTGDSSTTTASKVTLGTAKSIPNVTAATDVTVPIKDTSSTTVVTSKTHTVTDNGHTHSI